MKKIITTGINGLVGSVFRSQFGNQYEMINLGLDEAGRATDITDLSAVEEVVQSEPDADTILHLAAYTDVTGAFEQTGDKDGLVYRVNVNGTKNLVEMASSYNKRLILISTAYVFDGEKKEMYVETDEPNPIEWYGQTKRWAEEAVLEANLPSSLILRIDQPFASQAHEKPDVVQRLISGMKAGNLYPQFKNHYFGPTFIDDFAKVMDFALRHQEMQGIYHTASGEQWTDFELANLVREKAGLDYEVKAGDLEEYLKTLTRPYQRNTAMSVEKLRGILDFKLKTVAEAVDEVVANLK